VEIKITAGGRQIGLPGQPPYDVEAALPTEVNVYQDDVRSELRGAPDCVGAVRRHGHDHDALTHQQAARGLQEARAVIDDQATHGSRMASGRPAYIPATWTFLPSRSES
jgi:hypothetical protein